MKQGTNRLRGECLCRQVGYEVDDAFEYALNCHCSNCRRATGAAFKPFAGIRTERLTVVRGASDVMRFGEGSHDAHCKCCGSLLYSQVRDGGYLHVTLGTLIDPPSIRPTAHIFVGSKAPWFDICDTLPQFDEFPID
ncbi:GFA family protein [Pleomorphomonas sp. JP5]|uniref:GFA family protein n=1 Tax=Pleomorphomonas sp. JP5 TaxID=2942998 RepID=UPI0020439190|nr:GFA family protein [Pleomorphomonas sp. JP5]MCM5557982.1 GFA family protein [Pleomorphomonas sp. JP5]